MHSSHKIHRVQVVIIGGGQAGLSVSYHLKKRGINDHIIFERHRIAHSWREERWDSFCLVTPNFQCRLPDHPYDGDEPEGFMLKDEIVSYVERFAKKFHPPVREGVEVYSVRKQGGIFVVRTSIGTWHCDDVVPRLDLSITPFKPKGAEKIPSHITEIFATDYRNPEQIPAGEVLVVGSGQSGCQIAEDLHLAGRKVHLCLGNAPRSPRKYRGKDAVTWLEEMGYYKTTFAEHPNQAKALSSTNHYLTGRDGGREIDLRKFAIDGMKLYGFVEGIDAEGFSIRPDAKEKLDQADRSYLGICQRIDRYIAEHHIHAPEENPYIPCWEPESERTSIHFMESNISTIIWCVGFRPNFKFIEAEIYNIYGFPEHERGVTSVKGLYFIGLPWLHTWGSSRFAGIAEDAEHIVENIASNIKAHRREPEPALLS
ncbi:MAG: MSMEG_0569 family flavin-dependent oxidoreductase [Akkermansiaceae bacterium]|nr:MSMEG_0569 family flavin-dependent oxidoreductase [Akkermansiaceae bacterium]